ncbi:hypothetical protein D3C75_996690 [compost metagenome]
MRFLFVRADGPAAGNIRLVEQQRLARAAIVLSANHIGGPAHVVAVDPGGQKVAEHPFVPGQGVDLRRRFLQHAPCPIDAPVLGALGREGAVDQA